MQKRVVLLCLIALFSLSLSRSANALSVPVETPSNNTSLVGLIEAAIAGVIQRTETILASIGSAVGTLADGTSTRTPSVPSATPAAAYTAAAAASVASSPIADNAPPAPSSASNTTPTLANSLAPTATVVAQPATTDAVTKTDLSGFLTAFSNLISLLPPAIISPNASPSASPNADTVTTQQEIDALEHEVAQTNQINTLSNVTLISPNVVNGSLGSGNSSGGAGSFTSLSVSGASTLAGLTAASLSVTGTSTLAGINLANINCSTYGNGGKLTTDPFGNVVCAADQGGSGSTVAGANTQVQFNGYGGFAAASNFTYATSTNTLTVPNASTTNVSVSGNSILGNATSTSLFSPIADFTSAVINTLRV